MLDQPIHVRARAFVFAAATLFISSCMQATDPVRDGNELSAALAATATYEAENATVVGAVKITGGNAGASNGGYVDYQNANNDYIQWSVAIPGGQGGSYTVTFRYANGGTTNRPLSVAVGGATSIAAFAWDFPSTGSWTTWKTVSKTLKLNAGTNSIKATAMGSSGGNIDYLQINGPATTSTCSYPDWVAGKAYVTGNIVRYAANGNNYVATHDNPGYDPVISTWYWSPYTGCGSTTTPPPPAGSGLGAVLTESMFNSMFPNRNAFYTYSGLINAAGAYSSFGTSGDLATQKREVAAFLANVAHETGFLQYIDEIIKDAYCSSSSSCQCASGQSYYGRGPLQLSWNYNYCAAGAALGVDLRANPNLVSTNATVSWKTGLWFWMTQSGAGSRPCHQSMVNGYGFGETIRSINGSKECNGANPAEVTDRVNIYKSFCSKLGVDPGSNLGC